MPQQEPRIDLLADHATKYLNAELALMQERQRYLTAKDQLPISDFDDVYIEPFYLFSQPAAEMIYHIGTQAVRTGLTRGIHWARSAWHRQHLQYVLGHRIDNERAELVVDTYLATELEID